MSDHAGTTSSDVLIIGGGIIGTSLAYWLSRAGVGVTLVEKEGQMAAPGTASYASAGLLSPASTQTTPPPLLALMQQGLALYPTLIARLTDEQPHPTGYVEIAQLRLALNGAEVRNLQKRQEWYLRDGIAPDARWLTPDEVAEIEPMAGPNAGAILHRAAIVRAAWLTVALAEAARRRGATIRLDSPAQSLLGKADQVEGVRLANGDRLLAAKTVLTAGAWAGQWLDDGLAALGLAQSRTSYARAVWPVRGQMLALRPPANGPTLRHMLTGAHGYAYPRTDGSIAYGATVEPEAGFQAHMTPAGYAELSRLVHKLTPGLDNAPVSESWVGLRPGSASELPLLGPLPGLDGLWLSLGHFRSGVLLAPASAERLTQALLTNDPTGLADFAPQ